MSNVDFRVCDDLEETIVKKSKLRIAATCFSIYAYKELKKSLSGIKDLLCCRRCPVRMTLNWFVSSSLWENLIIQVGGVEVGQGKSLDEQIQLDEQTAKLQKKIEKVEKQARNEKQPNKKFQLARKLKKYQKKMEELSWKRFN